VGPKHVLNLHTENQFKKRHFPRKSAQQKRGSASGETRALHTTLRHCLISIPNKSSYLQDQSPIATTSAINSWSSPPPPPAKPSSDSCPPRQPPFTRASGSSAPVVEHRHEAQVGDLVRFDARAVHAAKRSRVLLLLLLLLVRSQTSACAGIAPPTRVSTFEHRLLAHPARLQRWSGYIFPRFFHQSLKVEPKRM
jgi:hypothetical protein